MKKIFITFILSLISFYSYAQFVNQDINNTKIQDFQEYKNAKSELINGAIYFTSGLVAETVGCLLILNECSKVKKTYYVAISPMDIPNNNDSHIGGYIGIGLAVGGIVTGIIGTVKLIKGSIRLKEAKINYAVQSGGIVISF